MRGYQYKYDMLYFWKRISYVRNIFVDQVFDVLVRSDSWTVVTLYMNNSHSPLPRGLGSSAALRWRVLVQH